MKKVLLMCCLLNTIVLSAAIDSLELNTKIKAVTVFFSGAEVQREGELLLPKGKHILILDQLPQELSPQSIQVEGIKGATLLSVKHQDAYFNASDKGKDVLALENKVELLQIKIKRIHSEMSVLKMEEEFLQENRKLAGKDKGVSTSELKSASTYYGSRIKSIRNRLIDLTLEIEEKKDQINDTYKLLNRIIHKNRQAYSQVLVAIECEEEISSSFQMSYYIPTAGWVPSYDFRVKEVDQPLSIVYNANVFQSSGEDWDKVDISLSSNNPSLSGYKPELREWNIGDGPSSYSNNIPQPMTKQIPNYGGVSAIKGTVYDGDEGEVVPFANVSLMQNGNVILGTITDLDGKYLLKPVPAGQYDLEVSYIGYQSKKIQGLSVLNDRILDQTVSISPSNIQLESVEIIGYKKPLFEKDQTSNTKTFSVYKEELQGAYSSDRNVRGSRSKSRLSNASFADARFDNSTTNFIDNSVANNSLGIEYTIKIPYTIPSDGKDYNLKIKELKVAVDYEYFIVPKVEKDAFLVAHLDNWEELNLISGKSSLYFKGKFTGESYINSEQSEDTLSISLGRDKGVFVSREENKKIDDRQFYGSNIKETIAWDIVVKNNKKVPVKITVEDQYPISDRKSIEVNLLSAEEAIKDKKTGMLRWKFELPALGKKELSFKYNVKYPRYMNLQTR